MPGPPPAMPTWSFTVNSNNGMTEIPPDLSLSNMALQHDEFPRDMQLALNLARELHLPSFTCTGMRAESPYETGNELVDISVRGMQAGDMFFPEMRKIATQPAHAIPPDEVSAAIYREHLDEADEYEDES